MGQEPDQIRWRGVQPVAGIRGVWPAIDSARIAESAYRSTNGTTILYTPGAGKRFFMSNCTLTSRTTADGVAYPYVFVRNGADALQYYVIYHYYAIVGQNTTVQSFMPAFEVEAGWDVCLTLTSGLAIARAFISGWEEDD